MPHNVRMEDGTDPAPSRRASMWSSRAGLLTVRPQPLPPLVWPRQLRWLPHTVVVMVALLLSATGADGTGRLLAAAHATTVVVALRWPVPAWWLSMGLGVGIVFGHPPTPDNQVWVWVVGACVLFLLALRVPIATTCLATVINALVLLFLASAGAAVGSWSLVTFGCTLFAFALSAGAIGQGRREDRARLAEQIAATAHERTLRTVLEERTRIARELHDVVAHHMSLISIQADAAPYRIPDLPKEMVTEFASIRATAQEGLVELRRMLGLLRQTQPGIEQPATAPQPSLAQLDILLASVRVAGLHVTAHTEGERRPLPPGIELSAYRIVQEALSNALRHAPGATATAYTLIAVTAFAMGLRNATVRKLGVPDLTTTVLTMTLTGLAADSRAGGGASIRSPRRTASVIAMVAGATLGAWLVLHHGLGIPLAIAAGLVAVLAVTASGRE